MPKNRRNQSAEIRFGPMLKAAVLCLLIGGSAVGYVWQKEQISRLEGQIAQREKRLVLVREQTDKYRKQLAIMRSATSLQKQAPNLGLVQPAREQIVQLREPSAEAPPAVLLAPGQVAENRPAGAHLP
jgi:hypothetical protein